MKWINAETEVEISIFDEQTDDHLIKRMTVEEVLDTYTNDGCPTIFSNPEPERKKGKWMLLDECSNAGYYCSECSKKVVKEGWSNTVKKIRFCPDCGADMRGERYE